MPARERTSNSSRPKGYTGRFGVTDGGGTRTQATHSCSDIIGAGDNAPFHVHHVTLDGGIINKPNVGFFSSWFLNYVPDILDVPDNFDHLGIIEDISNVDAATQAAARTNPSRPYVDVPRAIFELREVADLIHLRGNEILSGSNDITRRIGNENLRWQFGILPTMQDALKLLDFHEQVNRRVDEVNRLRSSNGLRRTVAIGSYGTSSKVNKFIQTYNTFIREDFDVSTSLEIRAHCRWLPGSGSEVLSSPNAMRQLVNRAVTGGTIDLSTLWQIIPWTWLLDWCGNVGQYFAAHRNIIPATLTDVSVMRHTRTSWSWPGVTTSDMNCTGIHVIREDKTRATSFCAPVAHFPFLSGSQLGIIASLAVTRT
jgi:hypothetical protein